jgi:hypothetical protein
MPDLITELGNRREHAADELSRPLEQLGVLAHRDDPPARNPDQARRLRPLDQQGQAVQIGTALDREAWIANVAGIQQLDQCERVRIVSLKRMDGSLTGSVLVPSCAMAMMRG